MTALIIIKRSYVSPEFMANAINMEDLGHAIVSWSVNGSENFIVFRVNTYEEQNRINRLPS